jgi:enoyl-CoA hydratase
MSVEASLERRRGAAVAHAWIDRGRQANALDAQTVEDLFGALDAAEDAGAALFVLESRGPTFCAGFDLTDLGSESDATLLLRFVRIQLLLERISSSSVLTVAVVDGPAVGAGADLALATSVRLATPRASLRFPGSGFGAVLGTGRLASETSPSFAAEVATTGRRIDAHEAELRGLWRVLPSADVEPELGRLAAASAALPADTGRQLRAAAAAPSSDALGDLVRSLVSRPGLRERLSTYAHQRVTSKKEIA